jgi:endo-1,3-1,4-beta-glycanase ExoK
VAVHGKVAMPKLKWTIVPLLVELQKTAVAAGLLLLLLTGSAWAQPSAANQSFFDDFASLDYSRWGVSDGWTNGEKQSCGWSTDEVAVWGGMLRVGFSRNPAAEGRAYRCGEIQTHQTFTYGIFEARIKTPQRASGLNAAFFTYGGPPIGAVHDEIDFEVLLKDPSRVQTAGYVSSEEMPLATPLLPQPADLAFTDYGFVWEPGRVTYYVNKKPVYTQAHPSPTPTHPQSIFFSLWSSEILTEWMGPFEDPGQPLSMEVDWVGFTALGERCLFPHSLTC